MSSADVYVLFMSLIYTVVITKYYTRWKIEFCAVHYFSFFFLRLFLPLLYLEASCSAILDVYTHLEMPGLWDSPWSMGIGTSGTYSPLPSIGRWVSEGPQWNGGWVSQWWSALAEFPWFGLSFCSVQPSQPSPLLSPGVTSPNKLPPHVLLCLNALCFGKTWARDVDASAVGAVSLKHSWPQGQMNFSFYCTISCYGCGMLCLDCVEFWLSCKYCFVFCLSFFLVGEADAFHLEDWKSLLNFHTCGMCACVWLCKLRIICSLTFQNTCGCPLISVSLISTTHKIFIPSWIIHSVLSTLHIP